MKQPVGPFRSQGFLQYMKCRAGYGIGIECLIWIEGGGLSLFTGDKRLLREGMSFHVLLISRYLSWG